ncbi:MAG: thiamine pyrophosphate-dependent enzyme [Armatimonadota bacterium]|jgi:pyruvate/2-oxoglutarate/acetoin dehydrogenase E1 component/TPP-dependent pyruvate/acetoin dehydrogenase alpha subunit
MPDAAALKDMLLRMYRIRLFEEQLKSLYDYRGFYGGELTDDHAAGGEDLLTCMLYDFASEGMIGGAVHLYIGEEAVAVGVCAELRDTDVVTSYHRGHGHAIAKGLDLRGMVAELMGRETGHSRGRGGSMHIYDHSKGMLGGNGIIGAQIPLALGAAFKAKYLGEDNVAVAFFGDGAANQGTFGECLNLASLWKLPVLFVCENNLWAASTAAEVAHCCDDIAPRAEPYGIPAQIVDGQDVLAVNEAAREAVERARGGGGPTMIEAKTFRYVGHAGAGQSAHRDPEAVEEWKKRDPLTLFEGRLQDEGVMTAGEQAEMREGVRREIDRAVAEACSDPFPKPEDLETLDGPPIRPPARPPRDDDEAVADALTNPKLLARVSAVAGRYAEKSSIRKADLIEAGLKSLARAAERYDPELDAGFEEYAEWWIEQGITGLIGDRLSEVWDQRRVVWTDARQKRPEPARTVGWGQAVAEALREEMDRDEAVFLIGEDLGPVTERASLWEQLRERRVFQTPISEAAFVGLGTGAAATGLRPVVEIMYMDFVAVCFDQIVNQCAPLRLMSGGQFHAPMVIKTPAGCGSREAAHHSGHHEAWFMHAPGLKVAIPSNAYDAKGLLKTAIRDDDPVLFIEHRLLRRSEMEVPEGEWMVPFGEAAVRREGGDVTVVATSYAVTKALRAAKALEGEVSVEVIDPRTLVPLDVQAILRSLAKTGRLLVVHEAPTRAGAGAEIVRRVMEDGGFDLLKAAPRVLARGDTPMPYSPPLEDAVIPQVSDIAAAVRAMMRDR